MKGIEINLMLLFSVAVIEIILYTVYNSLSVIVKNKQQLSVLIKGKAFDFTLPANFCYPFFCLQRGSSVCGKGKLVNMILLVVVSISVICRNVIAAIIIGNSLNLGRGIFHIDASKKAACGKIVFIKVFGAFLISPFAGKKKILLLIDTNPGALCLSAFCIYGKKTYQLQGVSIIKSDLFVFCIAM